jgi:hypothetical protein
MKEERPILQGFKKERLVLMETLKSFSFIATLPFSASTSPHTLFQQLNKKDANTIISHNRYILFDAIFNCIVSIFEFDLGLRSQNKVQFDIGWCFKLFDLYEETKMILEEFEYKDLSAYSLVIDASDTLEVEACVLEEIQAFNETGTTIFPDNITVFDIATKGKIPKTHLPTKIAMIYSIVYLMEIATEVGIKGIVMKDLDKRFLYIGYMMDSLGLAKSMKTKMARIENAS